MNADAQTPQQLARTSLARRDFAAVLEALQSADLDESTIDAYCEAKIQLGEPVDFYSLP